MNLWPMGELFLRLELKVKQVTGQLSPGSPPPTSFGGTKGSLSDARKLVYFGRSPRPMIFMVIWHKYLWANGLRR
jgi:hypothetical protein